MNLPLEIATTSFWIISAPFYVVVIAVLIAYRRDADLSSSFFALSVSLGFADLFEVTSQILLQRFPKRGWFVEEIYLKYSTGLLPVFCDQFVWYGVMVQYIGISLLTLNRFTAIVMPTRNDLIWTNRNLKLAIALQWGIPAAIYGPIPFIATGTYLRPTVGTGCGNNVTALVGSEVVCWMNEEKIRSTYISLHLPANTITLAFNSIAYVIIIASLVAHKFRNTAVKKNSLGWNNFAVEIKLTIAALIMFLILFGTMSLTLIVLFDICNAGFYFEIFYSLMDLFALCNPYLLVAFSTPLREHLLALLRRREKHAYLEVS
uniref:G-protein coupled receptors family 1 profile domain-containing protein n=1 Tax=Plectus sambesii TaxID=2011161 RepID=A0A914WPJ3_9BILA